MFGRGIDLLLYLGPPTLNPGPTDQLMYFPIDPFAKISDLAVLGPGWCK
jgi:hypothetical protein